jgi:uncharacterized membrane protein (UPF0127 family)
MKRYPMRFQGAHGAHTLNVLQAESMFERMRGLLGRPPLQSGEGMLLRSCNLIHTFGMRYAIDVVFLRRDGRVVKVAHALAPRRASGHLRAHYVLELAAGEAGRRGIARGVRLPTDFNHVHPGEAA